MPSRARATQSSASPHRGPQVGLPQREDGFPEGGGVMTRVMHIDETVTIGGDLTVGRIGYGAMQLTGPKQWGEYPDHDQGVALLREVVAAGVTFIDTADVYGPHSNEE